MSSSINMSGLGGRKTSYNVHIERDTAAAQQAAKSSANASTSSRITNDTVSISGMQNAANVAADATSAISSLRAKQLSLAEQAAALPQGKQSALLNSELQEMQTEIERVGSSATYNGQNVLGGATYGQTGQNGDGLAVSLADFSSLSDDPNVNLATQASAQNAANTIEDTFAASLSAANGASITADKTGSMMAASMTDRATTVAGLQQEQAQDSLPEKVKDKLQQLVAKGSRFENAIQASLVDRVRARELLKE